MSLLLEKAAHDVRSPLAVIKEYASLVADGMVGPLNEEQQRMLAVVEQRARVLNETLDEMMDLHRLFGGATTIWRRESGVAGILEYIHPALNRLAASAAVTIETDLPSGLPVVFCDQEMIGRALLALSKHAIAECEPSNSLRVWARCDARRELVCVGISGPTPKLEPRRLRRIQRSLRQVGAQPAEREGCLSRSLAIARGLVQLNLGEIGAASIGNGGSSFWFTIPMADPISVIARYASWSSSRSDDEKTLYLLSASSTGASSSDTEHLGVLLTNAVRPHDLLVAAEIDRWLICLPRRRFDLERFAARVERLQRRVDGGRLDRPLVAATFELLGAWNQPFPAAEIALTAQASSGRA